MAQLNWGRTKKERQENLTRTFSCLSFFTPHLSLARLPLPVDCFQRIYHSVDSKQARIEHHAVCINASPLSFRARFIIIFPVAVCLPDLVGSQLYIQFIELHYPADPDYFICINKCIDTVRIISENIVCASSYEDSRSFLRKFTDDR